MEQPKHEGVGKTLPDIQERLNYLNGTLGLSWRKIAAMDEFEGITHRTLFGIAREGRIPKSQSIREMLGLLPLGTFTISQFRSVPKERCLVITGISERPTSSRLDNKQDYCLELIEKFLYRRSGEN